MIYYVIARRSQSWEKATTYEGKRPVYVKLGPFVRRHTATRKVRNMKKERVYVDPSGAPLSAVDIQVVLRSGKKPVDAGPAYTEVWWVERTTKPDYWWTMLEDKKHGL